MNITTEDQKKDLRELRVSHGKTQADLGAKALISRYENGHIMPGPHMVTDMAERLGVTPQDIYAACEESCRRASAPSPAAKQPAQDEG